MKFEDMNILEAIENISSRLDQIPDHETLAEIKQDLLELRLKADDMIVDVLFADSTEFKYFDKDSDDEDYEGIKLQLAGHFSDNKKMVLYLENYALCNPVDDCEICKARVNGS